MGALVGFPFLKGAYLNKPLSPFDMLYTEYGYLLRILLFVDYL